MHNLILVVISIALMAAVAAAGINHIPADAYMRQIMLTQADTGIQSLKGTVERYLNANRDVNGDIVYPGANIDLEPSLAPAYGFIPSDIRSELTFDVKTGAVYGLEAVGICVRPVAQATDDQRKVLDALQSRLPVGSSFVGSGCNATTNATGGDSLTYWVVLNHLN